MGENVVWPALKLILRHSPFFFEYFGGYFASIGCMLPRCGQKLYFACFETGFAAFPVLFWALGWLFCLNRTYHCQDTGERVASPAFKPVFRHLPLFFEHFAGYFASIRRTFAKIQAKMLLHRLWNNFYGIFHKFLSTLVVVLCQSGIPLQRYEQKRFFADFESGFMVLIVFFWVIWW